MSRFARVSVLISTVLVLVCSPNNPPSAPVITASNTLVTSASEVALTATANDPDGDLLTWQWQASAGTFTNPIGPSTAWVSPTVTDTQAFTIQVTASDGDHTASADTSITVVPRSNAEEVEVIIGSADSTLRVPFDGVNHDYYRFQVLYLASEIGNPGRITRLSLMPSADSGTFNNFTVKMASVSRAELDKNFAANYETSTPHQVYYASSLEYYHLSDQWFELPLSSTFDYDTTSNLLVEFTWKVDNGKTVRSYGFDTSPSERNLGSEFEDAADGLPGEWGLYIRLILE